MIVGWSKELVRLMNDYGWEINKFSVKSMYDLVRSHLDSNNLDPILDLVWKNVAPFRIQCFGWLVSLGRVKTTEYLFKIGIIQNPGDAVCKFCGRDQETLDHLLLLCQPIWEIWTDITLWWGVQWVTLLKFIPY